MSKLRVLTILLSGILALPAFAGVAEDAIKLKQRGASGEVMQEWARRQSGFTLSPRQIIALKNADVPGNVIATLINRSGKATANPAAPSAAESRQTTVTAPACAMDVRRRYRYYGYGYPFHGGVYHSYPYYYTYPYAYPGNPYWPYYYYGPTYGYYGYPRYYHRHVHGGFTLGF